MNIPNFSSIADILIQSLEQVMHNKVPIRELHFSQTQQSEIQEYVKQTTSHIIQGDLSQEESLVYFLSFVNELSQGSIAKWSALTKIISFNRKLITQNQIIALAKFESR